jgi:hypothetical protein
MIMLKKIFKSIFYFSLTQRLKKILGIEILSETSLNNLYNSFSEIMKRSHSTKTNNNYSKGLTCIIFSKDRPLQLFALIESMNFRTSFNHRIIIIYKTSAPSYDNAYNQLILETKNFSLNIDWLKETESFKQSIIRALNTVNTKQVFFLTDDNIFINDFDFSICDEFLSDKYIFSLRHSKNITYSFTENKNFKTPPFFQSKINQNFLEFSWFETQGEWSDPWSIDGHIYQSNEIIILSDIMTYRGPNSYEAALKSFNFLLKNRIGVCSPLSIIINLPVNMSQVEIKTNRTGNVKLQEYLDGWNKKKKLDILSFKSNNLNSTHLEYYLPLIDR